eukprot:3523491-Prymnesium_polylepis.1
MVRFRLGAPRAHAALGAREPKVEHRHMVCCCHHFHRGPISQRCCGPPTAEVSAEEGKRRGLLSLEAHCGRILHPFTACGTVLDYHHVERFGQ